MKKYLLKILKQELTTLLDAKKHLEDQIKKVIFDSFGATPYLKQKISDLENGKHDRINFNDSHGVDYSISVDLKGITLEGLTDKTLLIECLKEWLSECHSMQFDALSNALVISNPDEIFIITKGKKIAFPWLSKNVSFKDEFHAWLKIEMEMAMRGEYPGVYDDSPSPYKWSDEVRKWAEYFPHDENERRKMLDNFLSYYTVKEHLVDNDGVVSLDILPKLLRDKLPSSYKLTAILVLEMDITAEAVTLKVESDKELKGAKFLGNENDFLRYEVVIPLISNTEKFILDLDKE